MDLITHPVFISVAVTSVICEVWKFIDFSVRHKRLYWKGFLETGGMPSSHATFVCALTMSVGFSAGFATELFLVSAGLSIIVVRDAFGVRLAVDKLAKTVNRIIHDKKIGIDTMMKLSGHTPIQAGVGVLLGVLVPIVLNYVFRIF